MAERDANFAGGMPQNYDHHMRGLLFQPYADDIAARLAGHAPGRLLETAAGTGIVTAALAAILPGTVEITATDLNQPMLDHAKTKPGMQRVRFQQADAQALPFPDASFDTLVCQFGVMFFPDKVQAFREARRVLKRGGRMIFNVWDERTTVPAVDVVLKALETRYPQHPSWFMERTPMGYRDPAKIRADLGAAGFMDAAIETVTRTGEAAGPDSVATGMCRGTPLRDEIEALAPDGLAATVQAVTDALTAAFGPGRFPVALQALVVTTQR
jgi:ubiquinone/menaquinone biosynthesis C-methylase UbiE